MPTTQTSRYAKKFAELQEQNRKAFIPFTLLGWPNADKSFEIIESMIAGGATMLELGLAFSDPAADGPIIQQAGVETLESGFTVDDALKLLRRVRDKYPDIPMGLLVYYNMVLARGPEQFFKDFANAGLDAVLIADLPPEMAHEVAKPAQDAGIDLIFIVSPLTSNDRLKKIGEQAGAFLYVVSRLGITGTEARYDDELQDLLKRIKSICKLPACVGFGISTPEQATNMVALGADGVITGSKVIQLLKENPKKSLSETLTPFVQSMVTAVFTKID
jgi:tryptophan synthase alpha chain